MSCDRYKSWRGRALWVTNLYSEGTGSRDGVMLGVCAMERRAKIT